MNMIRTYATAALVTAAIWAAVTIGLGWAGLVAVATLTVLEVTFSFDNAIVNSKLLGAMSKGWQRAFMTFGILVAVFVVRFALPILIVSFTANLSFAQVIDLAIHHPDTYAADLSAAGPLIDAFGGSFLLMIAIGFFLDAEKDTHWIGWVERRLAPLGRYDNVGIFTMMVAALVLAFTTGGGSAGRLATLVAAACGIALHVGLDIFGAIVEGDRDDEEDALPPALPGRVKVLVGTAAAVMFVRLEILDASFSFDGVIGAFAVTTSVVLIMAGLGAGAMWVRSMTVALVRAGTLAKYRYLEHGAHWAIFALGLVMLLKLYRLEPADWITGSIGLVFITLAVVSSVVAQRRDARVDLAAQDAPFLVAAK